MKQFVFCLILVAVGTSLLCGQDAVKSKEDPKLSSPRKRYDALLKEYNSAQTEYGNTYAKAKTDAERQKVHYPSAGEYADRFLAIARDEPADPAALDALVWVATNCRDSKEQMASLDLLLKGHLQSPKLGNVARSLIYARPGRGESWLRAVLKDSPHREVKGHASYSLGRYLISEAEYAEALRKNPDSRTNYERWMDKAVVDRLIASGPDPFQVEAEKFFHDVAANYSNVEWDGRSLADAARSELFELHNLAIGKVAPDIEGKDAEGEKFKLSAYRGKVVVIDFWGDW